MAKQQTGRLPGNSPKRERTTSKSMHDGIPVWYDCCSCEAEPYWLEAMSENAPHIDSKPGDNPPKP